MANGRFSQHAFLFEILLITCQEDFIFMHQKDLASSKILKCKEKKRVHFIGVIRKPHNKIQISSSSFTYELLYHSLQTLAA